MGKKTGAQIRYASMLAKHGARAANRDIIRIYARACDTARDSWKVLSNCVSVNDTYDARAQCAINDRLRGEAYDVLAALLDDYETIRIRERHSDTKKGAYA